MPKPNKLIHETSPYLLQHAYNPVEWQAWNEEALNRARAEDKPILLSIGYAACHWCHVMEHESFEDNEVANVMNENYICIKLDREERPDIDQIYMDAIQNMGLNGGWPLNVFLMPDQKPFYGGTYFPKHKWLEILDKVAIAFQNSRKQLAESADKFSKALNVSEVEKLNLGINKDHNFDNSVLIQAYQKLSESFDWDNGGTLGAPKFPMPVIWQFLMQYAFHSKNPEAKKALEFTLESMADGGIYDQIGGGFARYSVDAEWFAPHFEKMLYDNGQLISLYADAYRFTKNPYFKEVFEDSIKFMVRELMDPNCRFYSALDADSEGVEGKFYTWTYNELKNHINENEEPVLKFLNVEKEGNWENGVNILFRHTSIESFCKAENLDSSNFKETFNSVKDKLLDQREERIRPALDDKILTGWNALQLKGLCDAYKAHKDEKYKAIALDNFVFLSEFVWDGTVLYRSFKNDQAKIKAYLEDYALTIQALISLFEITSDLKVLNFAEMLANYTIENFYDEKEKLFFYTDKNSETLIARKKEIFDNVIPSSNSIMIQNLHWLGILKGNSAFTDISNEMLKQTQHLIAREPKFLSNWASAFILKSYPSYDVVIVGKDAKKIQRELWQHYLPNAFCMAIEEENNDELVWKGKEIINTKTSIYVCENNACQYPVFTAEDAIALLSK
ncbi:thioredoxin domain-containing protein [Marivirga arenosa]|uniref:Thioredoxin domain-containing protein n=1 Tax=Marivirga arenosa TaxID=3059076 RepID=A0AA51N632_9BACT|nr:thioredoxin domain-containing protein [Marivirga sp. ABR2-2]WMN07001.1 thioredoxin domain-containing protein [Marivirga sp. ABR2-2]